MSLVSLPFLDATSSIAGILADDPANSAIIKHPWDNQEWRWIDPRDSWSLQRKKASLCITQHQLRKSNHNRGLLEMLSLENAVLTVEEGMMRELSLGEFTQILRRCKKERNLLCALRMYTQMRKWGLDIHPSLGSHLLLVLIEVQSLPHAQALFDRLISRNACVWNALITGYLNSGELRQALTLYEKMQEEDSMQPCQYVFVGLLKACAKLKDFELGCKLHAHVLRKGLLPKDIFVGSTLISMYTKFGSLAKAQDVFNKLAARDVVVWNVLIGGYTENGCCDDALYHFELMQLDCILPDALTYMHILKACGAMGATDKGEEIHAEIVRKGLLDRNILLATALVDMYGKIGFIAEAQKVFEKLPIRDVVSWNALISGYAQHGCGYEALKSLKRMQCEQVLPDAVTYICILKACASIEEGQVVHAEIASQGYLGKYSFVASALIDMYAKCGSLAKAQEVSDELAVRDVASWSALIRGYVQHRRDEEALNCFKQMQLEGIAPNPVTFVCVLKACGSLGTIGKGQEIHAEIARTELIEKDSVVGTALIDMYAKCGWLAKAQEVFDNLNNRTVVSWNALIVGYAQHGHAEEALNRFEHMQWEGVSPNAVTFVCCLKACCITGAIDKGLQIHVDIASKQLETDLVVGSALVDMYAKHGLLDKAHELFDRIPVRDSVLWTAMVAGYAEHGHGEQALILFEQMQHEGISLDAVTFICSLKACGSIGALEKGREIHAVISKRSLLESDVVVGTALVDMYAKCGSLAKAQEAFDKLAKRTLVSWNVLVGGYAQLGETEKAFDIFHKMINEGMNPNVATFVSMLNGCSHTGLVGQGQTSFMSMSNEYGITPTLQHHTCMVDLLGRAGQLDKGVAVVKTLPLDPDVVVWHNMLGACKKWGNLEVGKRTFEQSMQFDEKDPAAYVFMSNIYSNVDDAHEATQVQMCF